MATQIKKPGTQSDPFNPNQTNKIDLNPTTYPGPRARPLQKPSINPRADAAAQYKLKMQNRKKLPQEQVPEQGGGPQLDEMPAQIGFNQNKPDWADPRLQGGGQPIRAGGYNLNDWMPKPGEFGPRGGDGGFMGMKDPRAGGVNKVTGQWTPPDPAYLEGLKNGTIEPEWKRKERLSDWRGGGIPGQSGEYGGINPGGGKRQPPGYGDGINHYGTDIKGMPGQGGQQVPGGGAIGGQKPVYSNSGGGTLGAQNDAIRAGGKPPQGPPMGGGRPGRQPLRPGMEYRPGGGQRPVGGGMQGAPQDGGQEQWFGENSLNQSGQGSGAYGSQEEFDQANPEWSAAGQSAAAAYQAQQGGQDPQEQMRRRLMMMQKQGPNSNPYYGAF